MPTLLSILVSSIPHTPHHNVGIKEFVNLVDLITEELYIIPYMLHVQNKTQSHAQDLKSQSNLGFVSV